MAMMNIHLFGAQTPSGDGFRHQLSSGLPSLQLFAYSRHDISLLPADFTDPASFHPGGKPDDFGLWVSFAPIWLFAPFLDQLALNYPDRLQHLRAVIACSSSSVITKRFACNRFDRELFARLNAAEDQLLSTCRRLDLPCRILRPTLIYGRVGPYLDKNLSRLIALMRWLPFLPLPSHTGQRQPIHASQLASVVMVLVRQFIHCGWDPSQSQIITLGGDSELSYSSMLFALQQSLPQTDPARRCRLLPVPPRLFYMAATPFLLQSPKSFEAVLRIGSDLSGFTPAYQLTKTNPQSFPLHPLL